MLLFLPHSVYTVHLRGPQVRVARRKWCSEIRVERPGDLRRGLL